MDMSPGLPDMHHRCGYIAIVGLPNAGKSTLMNRYLEEKISIVTPKPQTTRTNITSILSTDDYQIIFVDTPGLLKPRYRMQEVMASYISAAVDEADALLLMIDASAFRDELHPAIVEFARSISAKHMVIALNKIDLLKKHLLIPMIEQVTTVLPGREIFPISAATGENTASLLVSLLDCLPEGPKLFPDDIISNEPERFFAAELIRESVFLAMEREIPYATAVIIDAFEDEEDITSITASILVEKNSHKPILIGKNGATIKDIGTKARLAIEEFLGRRVYLELHVKVRKDWRKKDVFLRETGLIRH